MTELSIEHWLANAVAMQTGCPIEAVDQDRPIFDLGIDSVAAVRIADALSTFLRRPFDPADLFEFPTISALAAHLRDQEPLSGATAPNDASSHPSPRAAASSRDAFAIVGIACRMPGARNKDEFWNALRAGRDCIVSRPSNRPSLAGVGSTLANTAFSGAAGYLDDIDQFDAAFFRISPREAEQMDPQQRLLLQLAWEAFEDAGMRAGDLRQSDGGVFVGISHSDYSQSILSGACSVDSCSSSANALSVAANRLSFYFDLVGPSLAIDTACSSSLTAAHLAISSLRAGECGFALVAGVNLLLSPELSDSLSLAGMLSRDHRCKPFSALADGYVRGEGCAVIILKRFERALADNDRIYAIVAGSAVGQNGRSNGLTAPNPRAQESILRAAARCAGVNPATIDYVEAHGTGTSLGDHVEMTALGRAFGSGRDVGSPLLIGTVKSNIGHLEAAAGMAGLVKVALAVYHGEIPGTLHAFPPSPSFDFSASGIEVVHAHRPWPDRDHPRTAGVSSFGFGGTNAHLIVQEAPRTIGQRAATCRRRTQRLIALSARTPSALKRQARCLQQWIETLPSDAHPDIEDLAYSSIARREALAFRRAFVAGTLDELAEALARFTLTDELPARVRSGPARAIFQFGVPSREWLAGVWDHCRHDRLFVSMIRRCDEQLETLGIAWRIEDVIATPARSELGVAALAVQLGVAQVLKAAGATPSVLRGTGSGYFAAAVAAGELSLRDAVCALLADTPLPTGDDADVYAMGDALDAASHLVCFVCGGDFAPGPDETTALPTGANWSAGTDPLADALACWFAAGGELRYRSSIPGFKPSLVSMPSYAWETTRYWIEAAPRRQPRREATKHAIGDPVREPASPQPASPNIDPDSDLEASLLSIWLDIVGRPSASVTDTLLRMGKPADIATFQTRIVQTLGVTVKLDLLTRFPTIRDLARALRSAPDDRNALSSSADRGAARRYAMGHRA